jgi:nucleoside-diphosphate kinase
MLHSRLANVLVGCCLSAVIVFTGFYLYKRYYTKVHKIERTLAIIKPDAVAAHLSGKIIDRIEQEGFTIVDMRKISLDRELAEKFYAEFQGKPFFHQLVDFMTSGPIMVLVLEKLNAIDAWRELMGFPDPKDAKEGTLRKQFGTDIGRNAVHGSNSPASAEREIPFFFADRPITKS